MEELNNLATFLGVSGGKLVIDAKEQIPVLKAGNGLTVRGLVSVAKQLVRQSDSFELKGTTPEERAAIDQWLEYRVTQVDKSHQDKDVSTVLKDTNTYLSNHVYFVGYQPTLADIILYLGLYRIFEELTFMDKQKYIHVSRWFSNVSTFFCLVYIHFPASRISYEVERIRNPQRRKMIYSRTKNHLLIIECLPNHDSSRGNLHLNCEEFMVYLN